MREEEYVGENKETDEGGAGEEEGPRERVTAHDAAESEAADLGFERELF